MRICFLADADSWHTKKWLEYFVDRGHEIHIISTTEFSDKRVCSHRLETITFPGQRSVSRFWNSYRAFRETVKSLQPDILHAISLRNGLFGAMMGYSPFVVTGLGWDVTLRPKTSFLKRLESAFILSRVDFSTTESIFAQNEMLKYQRKKNSEIVLFGVDKREFHLNVATDALKAQLRIDDERVILSPRSMVENMNIDVLVRAIPLVLEKIPRSIFVFKYNFGHLQPRMEGLARSLGVLPYTRFVGYVKDYGKMPAFYKLSDVTVSIPSSDNTARAWFESIACGTPLILSDIQNTREWFKHKENALIVNLRDLDATANSIIQIIENDGLRSRLTINARRLVETKADYVHNMQKMELIYTNLTS